MNRYTKSLMRCGRDLTVVVFAGIVGAAGAGSASAQPAAAAPNAATSPITQVTAQLPAGSFDRVLPFDVPFFIVGAAPDGTVRLEVQYRESRSRDIASATPWLPATPRTWVPEAPTSGGQQFLIFMRDTLEAERYFQFRFTFFRQPSAEQAARFRAGARDLFDDRLALVAAASVPLTDAPQIRDDLAAIIRSVTGSAVWQPAPGSIFDTTDASAAAMVRFLEGAVDVLGPQGARAAVLRNAASVRLLLESALLNIQASGELATTFAAAQKLNNDALNALLAVDAGGTALLTLGGPQLVLAAAGNVAGDRDLLVSMRPDGPAQRAGAYAQLVQQLQLLDHFGHAVSDAGGAARPLLEPVVGAPTLAQVAALLRPGGAIADALTHARRLAADMTQIAAALTERDAALVTLTEQIVVLMRDERFIEATSVADGATTQNNYISADGGILYAGDIGTAAVFIGSNIYLRPVNKDAPLSQKGSFSRRFAFTVGMTVSSVADENERTRSDLFGNSGLVLGAGIRVTQSIRLGGGVLVFKEADENPLVTKKSAATTWYMSFSFDLDVAKGLQGLGGQFQ